MGAHCAIRREQRRQALIMLVADNGGDHADFFKVARLAIAMAIYPPRTNPREIRLFIERVWHFRERESEVR